MGLDELNNTNNEGITTSKRTELNFNRPFEGKVLKFPDGSERDLVLTNWGEVVVDTQDGKRRGIEADCLKADGEEYPIDEKFLRSTSVMLCTAIAPILEIAKKENRTAINVRVSRKGTGFDTTYFVKEIK